MSEPALMLTPGPHLKAEQNTVQIMWTVTATLVPTLVWATVLFGWNVVALVASGIAGAGAGEYLVTRLRHQRASLIDGSGVLTGILLVGTLSPGLPWWMPAIGGFVAIVFGKMVFGGLGFNIFNPALVGRAFLMASFPLAMTTTWRAPFTAVTQATPLTILKLNGWEGSIPYLQFFLGEHAGSIGEVSVLLILVGAAVLLWKRIITLTIPLSVIAGLGLVAIFSGVPLFHLLTGGLWFGAFYMATDYVTAPMLAPAQIIFGVCIGILTGVIRIWGGYPEGICYAILIMNAVTPALNRWFRPKRPQWKGAPS